MPFLQLCIVFHIKDLVFLNVILRNGDGKMKRFLHGSLKRRLSQKGVNLASLFADKIL